MADGTYKVSAGSLESLLQTLKPLGTTIQYSAQQHQPVQFTRQSLAEFGNAVEAVEAEVKRQRSAGELFGD